jgi:hypothetical protein
LFVAAAAMVATLPGRTQGLGLITEPLLTDLGIGRVDYAQLNLVGNAHRKRSRARPTQRCFTSSLPQSELSRGPRRSFTCRDSRRETRVRMMTF